MSTQPTPNNVSRLFDMLAEDYDGSGLPFFQPIARGLVDQLAPRGGERVLDIGCGRGAATVPLANAVLPAGTVTAIDLSSEMVRLTLAAVDELGAPPGSIEVAVMDASHPTLPEASYDVIASSLVLFFLPEPATAARRWVRLLAPGGRIGLSTFGAYDDAWRAVDALFIPYLPPQMRDPRITGAESPFTSDAGVEALLADAGAIGVTTVTQPIRLVVDDAAGWRRFTMTTGQRGMWASVPEQERPKLFERAAELLEGNRDRSGKIVLTQHVRYTLGQAHH
jgi:ubiquinone/menaquinone biosynthesis C-methylase UbiE